MSKRLERAILDSKYFQNGEPFKASDIYMLLSDSKRPLKVTTIKKTLGKLREQGLLTAFEAEDNKPLVYTRAAIHVDGKPLASRPWRPGRVFEDHSPRWC